MAKNISLLGADYPDVPAVVLPKTGGGTAMFVDADSKMFVDIYNDYINGGTSKTYTLTDVEQTAMVFVNAGNGAIAVWTINFRLQNEIGITKVTDVNAYTTITTSGMTFTISCTYNARVKVIVF